MSMPPRLRQVSQVELPDHHHLAPTDQCLFWGEYTSYEHTGGLNWNYSPTNRLISNLKKDMSRKGRSDWPYKSDAIRQIANAFAQMLDWTMLHNQYQAAVIPIPPSKHRADPMYDPRLMQILQNIAAQVPAPIDIRDCLSFDGSLNASHSTGSRPTPQELFAALAVDAAIANAAPPPRLILLFDDMLTTGAHFIAARNRLVALFPAAEIVGLFVARRRVPSPFD